MIATGVWRSDETFIPDDRTEFTAALRRIQTVVELFCEAEQRRGDLYDLLKDMGISDALMDTDEFATVLHELKGVTQYDITVKQYDRYQWLMEVIKHTFQHGDAIWSRRVQLLGRNIPQDWFVLEFLERQ